MSSDVMISFRPAQVIRQLPWQFDGKTALGFLLILVAFSLVAWLYLSQASAMAATSYRIDELRLEIDQLQNQNAGLSLEIAQLEALPRVQARAQELGFRPVARVQYLSVANYPAQSGADSGADMPLYLEAGPINNPVDSPVAGSWFLDALDWFVAWLDGPSTES